MSIPMAIRLRHNRSMFYQLFIIVSIALTPSTLNVRHGAVVLASAVSASSSPSSSSTSSSATTTTTTGTSTSSAAAAVAAASAAAENNYELHAAHISIDSIMMAVDNNNDLSQLTFEPNFLHFDELSVGETANKVVTIFNRHSNRSVYLGSISGSVSDFYSSFFEENLVPPMGNTTFNVVFLPRQQSVIQAHLIIHTSFGVLNYEVKGKGVECPYRLSPLIGLKAPFNATLMPEIIMYNPYDTPLQIVEVYSSGGQFQLELPTGDDTSDAISATHFQQQQQQQHFGSASNTNAERSQTIWEIPPHCSKPVIRVRFTATHVGNSTAYIRIKVSARKNAALEKAVIVLPIEVEIFKEHGIYSSTPFLNFGLSGTNDRPKSVTFRLLNSGNELYDIDAYTVEAEENVKNGISLEMNTVRGDTLNETYHTITATVDWSRISAEQFFRGNILIQTKRKDSMHSATPSKQFQYRVPFVGGILRGSIQYNESLTRFHQATTTVTSTPSSTVSQQIDKSIKSHTVRDFLIKNNFDVTLAITNLTMSPDTLIYFRAENFNAKLLAPGEEATIFQIIQQPAAAMHSVTRSFHLHTNVSVYDIELFSFNGLLKRLLPITDQTKVHDSIGTVDEKSINFGILPLSTQSQIMLALVNHNPIPINIHNWKGTISSAAHIGITVPGCSKLTMKGLKFCNIVKPGEWIVFQIGVTSNTVGTFEGKFTVQTDYEVISTPIRFSTDMGILKFTTKLVDSENCFPGGVCRVNLTAYSTFTRSMHIKTIQANNVCLENASKVDSASAVDLQDFDGNDECHTTNLSRMGGSNGGTIKTPYIIYEDGEKPVIAAQSESFIDQLEIEIPQICDEKCALDVTPPNDDSIAEAQRQRFLLLKKQLDRFHALSAKFQKLTFHVQTNHIKRYDFNGSIDIVWPKLIKGPIEFAISQVGQELTKHIDVFNPFDAALQIHYQIHDVDVQQPPEIIDKCSNAVLTADSVFTLGNNRKESDIVTIPPKTYHKITLKFMSDHPGTYGTLLYIRNNFTVLEAEWITAKSVVPQFKFGNRKPGSKTPLLFGLTDKHLRDCPRLVTAKRTFTAKNSGEVPIFMRELRIEDLPCEGYGYRILECEPFELPPNGSRKIEIAFTPDFTLASVKKTLYLETSLNYSVNYTLHSQIAPLSLSTCSKALARPEWESVMKNVTAVVLAVSFIFVLFAAYLDSMKVLKVHVENMSKAKGSLQPALDLRQIGLKSYFSDDITTKSGSTSGTAATSTASPSSSSASCKQSGQSTTPLPCQNASKTNGSICKKKTSDKKRVTCSSNETITPKKSYITEIAKKLTPKKSETKQKSEQLKPKSSPPSTTSTGAGSTTTAGITVTSIANNRKEKRHKDELLANFEEDETSSTTTESSSHSDDKSPNVKTKLKKPNQSKDLSTVQHSKDKKISVHETKSLPLNYTTPDVESTLSVPLLSAAKKNHDESNDEQNSPFDVMAQSFGDDSIKGTLTPDSFSSILGTPPNKSIKLMNGKTPGRERNKTNEQMPYQRRSFDTDNLSFKSTAFEFSSPLAESPTSGSHPLLDLMEKTQFDHHEQSITSKSNASASTIPLSSILKHQSAKSNGKSTKSTATKTKNEAKSKDRKNTKKHSQSGHSSFENLASDSNGKASSSPSVDLGPIGTRKSPSSTPIWEPMHSIHNPMPSLATGSNSFFTGVYPQTSTYQRNDSTDSILNQLQQQSQQPHINTSDQFNNFRQQLQNAETLRFLNGLYGNNNLEQHKPNLWDSTLRLNLLQQQQQQMQQQQQQQAQQQLAQQLLQSVYSSASNSLWNSGNMFDTPQVNQSNSYWSSVTPSVNEVRPPPGFSGHTARDQRTLQEQLFQQQQIQKLQAQQQQQQQQQQLQQQQQRQQQNQTAPSDPMQYDLFSSLSSIWSSDNSWNNQNDPNKKTK